MILVKHILSRTRLKKNKFLKEKIATFVIYFVTPIHVIKPCFQDWFTVVNEKMSKRDNVWLCCDCDYSSRNKVNNRFSLAENIDNTDF